MTDMSRSEASERKDEAVEPTAQDVIDALRLVLTQDDADVELIKLLVAQAPDTDSGRGVALLLDLIREGTAVVRMT